MLIILFTFTLLLTKTLITMDLRKLTTKRLEQLIAINKVKETQMIYQNAKVDLAEARTMFEKALDWKLKNE